MQISWRAQAGHLAPVVSVLIASLYDHEIYQKCLLYRTRNPPQGIQIFVSILPVSIVVLDTIYII